MTENDMRDVVHISKWIDHTQQTHQVLMLHLPGGRRVWGEGGLDPHPSMPSPHQDSRHDRRLVQEGLGCHVALDVLHGHLLSQVLTLQDGWGPVGEEIDLFA